MGLPDWTSGKVVWVIDAAGDAKMIGDMVARLRSSAWGGRQVKMRTWDGAGALRVETLPALNAA